MNPITYQVALEIASHEAVIRQAYKDSVGVWTWSVGLTSATGHDVERYIGKPQTLEHCLAVYVWALNNYADDVRSKFKGRTLTEAQFAAAVSFHWNTGSIRQASWVTKWLAGDIAGARKAFMTWNKPVEIIGRRQKECDLFFDGKWSNDGSITEYTRVTASGTPVWSSAKRVDIQEELNAAFATADTTPALPAPPVTQPPSPVVVVEPAAPIVPAPPASVAAEPDWQPALTVPEYLAMINTSTAAIAKLTAGA